MKLFFIGIFGMETKEKEIRDIQNVICKACGQMTSYRLVKTYNYFHIFFIPLFKWGKKYYLISRCCNSMFEIPVELGEALEGGRDVPVRDEDLTPIHHGYSLIICPSCRRHVDPEYSYCPYCGTRIR